MVKEASLKLRPGQKWRLRPEQMDGRGRMRFIGGRGVPRPYG